MNFNFLYSKASCPGRCLIAVKLSPEFRFSITQSVSVRLSSRQSLSDWDCWNPQRSAGMVSTPLLPTKRSLSVEGRKRPVVFWLLTAQQVRHTSSTGWRISRTQADWDCSFFCNSLSPPAGGEFHASH
jgi:hypothetical protein